MYVFRVQPVIQKLLATVLFFLFFCIPLAAQAAQVTLAWDANDPVPDGYLIFQRLQGGVYDYSQPVWSGSETTCTIDNLADNTTYDFVVRAYVGTSESGDSNEVSFQYTTPSTETFTLTSTAGANGLISPSGSVSVSSGSSQTFAISANSGYHINDVLVDGTSVGAVSSYSFSSVTADHTISASFAADSYTLTATAGANGSISPSGSVSVDNGGSQTYTISANSGYSIGDVLVDGTSVGAVSSYTFSSVNANHSISASFRAANQPPVADAGPDQTVDEGQSVVLSGSNSRDMDDGIASMQWRQIQGPTVTLNGATQAEATFTAPNVDEQGASLVFELTVTDYSGAQSSDTCIVNVSWVNMPPKADAGPDQTVNEVQKVTLSAAGSSDPDDGIAAYRWVQVQGPSVTLSDPTAIQPSFTAPPVGTQGASLQFELTVTDQGGLQDTDSCIVSVAWVNSPPVANAGPDQVVSPGNSVVLDGSASTDPDDGIAKYEWKQTAGPPVNLSDATAIQPVFTAPQAPTGDVDLSFQLIVTDNGGLQSQDQCQITVQAAQSQQPDTTPPTVAITNPDSGFLRTKYSQIALAGTAGDNIQVDHVSWSNSKGGSGQATGTTQWQIPEVDLSHGSNVITVTAYDTAGNSTSTSITVNLSSSWKHGQ